MKKFLKTLLTVAAMTTVFGFFSCAGGDEVVEPAKDPEGSKEITLVEDLALSWSGNDTICEGKDIAKGGTIYFTITTDGKQELQFIKKSWAGGLGKNVITILNSDDADVTYYSGSEDATTEDEKDRPSVSLDTATATYHFVVTETFVTLKDVATVVGTAKLDKMWYVAPKAE